MNCSEIFKNNGYLYIQKFLDEQNCKDLANILKSLCDKEGTFDSQCTKSKSITNNKTFDKLLLDLLPYIEKETGYKLIPTYAYARLYSPGETLKIHRDRESCEISATLTLDFEGDSWPIFMGMPSNRPTDVYRHDVENNIVYVSNSSKIEMDIGDIVLYKGCEIAHWRDEYKEGKWQAQVFLHYVDANGPHKEWAFDKRPGLNLPTEKEILNNNKKILNNNSKKETLNDKNDDFIYAIVYNAFTPEECDQIIKNTFNMGPSEASIFNSLGSPIIDKNIRNVNRYVLPTVKGIGATLSGIGLAANKKFWNFDIDYANQAEILRYPAGGGRYTGHIDTIMSNSEIHRKETRKLTALAFLNDNYTGGKFFLQTSNTKEYPPQEKGTVIIFPSFILHGVEDVIEGERYSVVTWMVGPWFK